jgi:hypothetical protein
MRVEHATAGRVELILTQRDERLSDLSIKISNASKTHLDQLLARKKIEIRRSCMYPEVHSLHPYQPPLFGWPLNAAGKETEVPGYPAALEWLQQHVCPKGIVMVDKHSEAWIDA